MDAVGHEGKEVNIPPMPNRCMRPVLPALSHFIPVKNGSLQIFRLNGPNHIRQMRKQMHLLPPTDWPMLRRSA